MSKSKQAPKAKAQQARGRHRRALLKMKTDYAAKRAQRDTAEKYAATVKGKVTRALKAALTAAEYATYIAGVNKDAADLKRARSMVAGYRY